jgi:hypothetical protein
MTLRVGEVLEKKRGGGTKKATVVRVSHGKVCLSSETALRGKPWTWWLHINPADGLPEGYRRAEARAAAGGRKTKGASRIGQRLPLTSEGRSNSTRP